MPARRTEGHGVNNSRASFPESHSYRSEAAREEEDRPLAAERPRGTTAAGRRSPDPAWGIWQPLVVGLQTATVRYLSPTCSGVWGGGPEYLTEHPEKKGHRGTTTLPPTARKWY